MKHNEELVRKDEELRNKEAQLNNLRLELQKKDEMKVLELANAVAEKEKYIKGTVIIYKNLLLLRHDSCKKKEKRRRGINNASAHFGIRSNRFGTCKIERK